jgi:hypothetical protein
MAEQLRTPRVLGLDDPPRAQITRQGRWIYHIDIVHGIIRLNAPWIAFGRAHAEKRARKRLAWYQRKFGPPRERWTIQ